MTTDADLQAGLRERALQWLAQREHSRQELRDKLERWICARQTIAAMKPQAGRPGVQGLHGAVGQGNVTGGEPAPFDARPAIEILEGVLDALAVAGHLSEHRFIESRVRTRASRHGNRRIEHELRRHGVTAPPDTLQALAATEYERARQVWQRKFGIAATTPAERARQMRFMAGRGFTPETVRRVLAHGPTDDIMSEPLPDDPAWMD